MNKAAVVGATAVFIVGCAVLRNAVDDTRVETPAQGVYEAGVTYQALGQLVVQYINLPRCGASSPQVCSNEKVVDQLKRADNVAYTALLESQKVVGDPNNTKDVMSTAASSASSAISFLQEVLKQYNLLKGA